MIDLEGGFESSKDEANRFQYSRKGDSFINIFQCDVCHFENVNKRLPNGSACDQLYLKYIRRATLDCF